MAGDLWDTARFVDSVRLPYIAPSLGGVETLIEQPTVISYWDQARLLESFVSICQIGLISVERSYGRAQLRYLLRTD